MTNPVVFYPFYFIINYQMGFSRKMWGLYLKKNKKYFKFFNIKLAPDAQPFSHADLLNAQCNLLDEKTHNVPGIEINVTEK